MMLLSKDAARFPIAPVSSRRLDRALRRVLEVHFDPENGSPFWLDRERELGWRVLDRVRSAEDLDLLGFMDEAALRDRSAWDFVPRRFRSERSGFVAGETGGTLGTPKRTLFHPEDFEAAFVRPFVEVARRRVAFPSGALWAFIGPTGPHIIGKAARAIASAMGSPDPFTIDLDPRWFKSQAAGSIGRARYLQHLLDQALTLFRREPIEVLFSTPPLVAALGEKLPPGARLRVRAVHLGGLAPSAEGARAMRERFPCAVFLGGYGNSLLGVCPQLDGDRLERPRYYPHGDRLRLRVMPLGADPAVWKGEQVPYGERSSRRPRRESPRP